MSEVEDWPAGLQVAWDAWHEGRPWHTSFTVEDVPKRARSEQARAFLKIATQWARSAAALREQSKDKALETAESLYYWRMKGVSTLEPLLVAQALASLGFEDCKIPPLAPLAHLPALRSLSLLGRGLTDLGPLESFPALKALMVGACAPLLAGVSLELDRLAVRYTSFSDPGVLSGCRVRHLQLGAVNKTHYVNVGDDAVFPAFPHLERLDVKTRAWTHLRSIAGLRTLRALYVARNKKLRSLDGLQDLPLEVLAANLTSVRDLAPLAGLPLRHIYLDNTAVRDVTPLLSCPELRTVSLRSTPVADDAAQLEALTAHVHDAVYTDWKAPYGTDRLDEVVPTVT